MSTAMTSVSAADAAVNVAEVRPLDFWSEGQEREPESPPALDFEYRIRPMEDPSEWRKPKADGWSPPDTRILLQPYHGGAFRPTGAYSVPGGSCTFQMPSKIANDLAVRMNQAEIDLLNNGKIYGRWHVVIRGKQGGYQVLSIERPADWNPQSEFELPPNCVDGLFTNLIAVREAKRFNTVMLRHGVEGHFRWAIAIRPLRPLWEKQFGA